MHGVKEMHVHTYMQVIQFLTIKIWFAKLTHIWWRPGSTIFKKRRLLVVQREI